MPNTMSAEPSSPGPTSALPGAQAALWLLLGINLFNYIDRQVLSAVLPRLALDATLFRPDDPNLQMKLGWLTTAFLVSYMFLSPVFGSLSDSRSRWLLVGVGVTIWSLASGGSGLATTYVMLILTRCLVGIGEAAYGPVAPAMLSDMYPERERGKILARFYLAIPVGSALGFVIGGQVAGTSLGWRGAFLVVVLPGLLLGALCFFRKDPPRTAAQREEKHGLRDYGRVFRRIWNVPSFRRNTIAMTASTFILGGVAAFAPIYIFQREARFQFTETAFKKFDDLKASDGTPVVPPEVVDKLRPLIAARVYTAAELREPLKAALSHEEIKQYNDRIYDTMTAADSITIARINLIFGAIVVLSGLFATLLGGILGDRLRDRYRGLFPGGGLRLHRRVPIFPGDALCAVPIGVAVHVYRRLWPVLQHRTSQHDPGQRRPLLHSGFRLRHQHPDHSPAGRRHFAAAHRPDRRRFEPANGVFCYFVFHSDCGLGVADGGKAFGERYAKCGERLSGESERMYFLNASSRGILLFNQHLGDAAMVRKLLPATDSVRIAAAVRAVFQETTINALKKIKVKVTSEEVILAGVVPSMTHKRLAREMVQRALAGRQLRNRVEVRKTKGGEPTFEELSAERQAIKARMVEPTDDEVKDEWRWIMSQYPLGTWGPYTGTHVAVLNQQIIGADRNSLRLDVLMALRHNVHPDRLVVTYIEPINNRFGG